LPWASTTLPIIIPVLTAVELFWTPAIHGTANAIIPASTIPHTFKLKSRMEKLLIFGFLNFGQTIRTARVADPKVGCLLQ
jgi:hypothetical protein